MSDIVIAEELYLKQAEKKKLTDFRGRLFRLTDDSIIAWEKWSDPVSLHLRPRRDGNLELIARPQ